MHKTKNLFIFTVLFILLFLLAFVFVTKHKDREIVGILNSKELVLSTNLKVIYHTHEELAEFIYNSQVNMPKIIDIFKDAQNKPKQTRTKLLENLNPLYQDLKKMGLKQFQFHLPNGDSFLRFHRPNRFGDNLLKDRETVAYVSKYHKAISGFEEGKIFSGFRFVYPLFLQKKYIGSVEISFNTNSFIQELTKLFPLQYAFIIKKNISDNKVFNAEKIKYIKSAISDNYYVEKRTINPKVEDIFKNNNFKNLDEKLAKKDSFVLIVRKNNSIKTLTFLAIKNPITNKNVAFVVGGEDDFYLFERQQEYHYILATVFLLILGTLMFIYREIKHRMIHERKNEETKAILKKANTAIITLDLEGNFLNVNDYFCKTLEYSREEILKTNCPTLTLSPSAKEAKKNIKKVKEKGFVNDIQKICRSKSGHPIHFHFSLRLLPDKKSFVAIGNSLEDKMRIEDQNKILLGINNNLKEQVENEVEKNLEQNRLHQDRQLADAKFTSIGQLAAGITHEINTPLTYIKANFEMMGYDIEDLPDSVLKTRMLEDRKSIDDGISRLSNIVESMREISQKSKEARENVNLYASLSTALTIAHNRSKQISQIYLQGELFEIGKDKNRYTFNAYVQKQRIEQVWIVIINNALDELVKIKTFEKRKIEISLLTKNDTQIVRIKDNAGGIDEKIMSKIFEPFESTKESSGMGVGLNIAKKIIEEQDGTIRAYNEDGGGAVFEVRLIKKRLNH